MMWVILTWDGQVGGTAIYVGETDLFLNDFFTWGERAFSHHNDGVGEAIDLNLQQSDVESVKTKSSKKKYQVSFQAIYACQLIASTPVSLSRQAKGDGWGEFVEPNKPPLPFPGFTIWIKVLWVVHSGLLWDVPQKID